MVNDIEFGLLSSFTPVTSWQGSVLSLHWDALKVLQGSRGRKSSWHLHAKCCAWRGLSLYSTPCASEPALCPCPASWASASSVLPLTVLNEWHVHSAALLAANPGHNHLWNNVHCAFSRMWGFLQVLPLDGASQVSNLFLLTSRGKKKKLQQSLFVRMVCHVDIRVVETTRAEWWRNTSHVTWKCYREATEKKHCGNRNKSTGIR